MTNSSKIPKRLTRKPATTNTQVDLTDTTGEGLWLESGFTILVWAFALGTAALLFCMSGVISKDAWPAISQFGAQFLWSPKWDIGGLEFGALPFIYGTIVSSAIAIILAIPLGLSVAIVTSENFLPIWIRSPLGFMVELISAIPSVIIGLWGIFVLIPFLLPIQQWLFDKFNWFPLFNSEPLGPGMLPAGVLLSIMILPTVAAISRDVLLSVPVELRSASMSLGATRWETIFKLLLPAASSGIIGATILALGRALGNWQLDSNQLIFVSSKLLNSRCFGKPISGSFGTAAHRLFNVFSADFICHYSLRKRDRSIVSSVNRRQRS
jgi:phosphate transport system permease protein